MQSTLNRISNKNESIDHENLNIVIRPRPPRRRQSGASLVPFRPYVKQLTSVRQAFSYANGHDKWMTMGRDEIFFTQPNARCIGSLLEDCDVSDVIRWDIEGESTRLPMMCKLWMIVDGAIVERGKPHLVQDAAVQVLTSGRNLRTILAAYQRYNQTSGSTTSERRRRHSWHDVNEYHSVPYYQYSNTMKNGYQQGIQCDLDNEQMTGKHEILSDVEEEAFDDENINDFRRENLREIVHHHSTPRDTVSVSITTQTESLFCDQSTSTDSDFIRMYNLNLETNEILLSSIVNPYRRAISSTNMFDTITIFRNHREYKHRSTSTGDDCPHWWTRLTTDFILSNLIRNLNEEKEIFAPSPRCHQSVQTDLDKSGPSSSSITSYHYEIIDDIDRSNLTKRYLTYSENSQRIDSGLSDCQIESSSIRDFEHSHRQLSYSTPRNRTKSSESTSTSILANLLERYERSLRERQRTIAIVNNELLDIDDVLKYYREKIQNSTTTTNTTMDIHHRDLSLVSKQSNDDYSTITYTNLIKDKYRSMPAITSHEMIQAYVPSPRIHLATSIRQRQPRFLTSSNMLIRPNYCDLCSTDHYTSSAWVRYNERRIEELQKRIDIMLQIDDNEEAQLLLTPDYLLPSTTVATVSQRIDDLLTARPRYPIPTTYIHDRLLLPRHLPYRLNQSLPSSPRKLSRRSTRSTTPVSKSVRISTHSVPPRVIRSHSPSRPIVSILRRSSVPTQTNQILSSIDVRKSQLTQSSIPRYYRLYNDAEFREVYNISRVLDTYLDPTRPSATNDYSTLAKSFAIDHQIPTQITSAA